jgi:hypothetical protein
MFNVVAAVPSERAVLAVFEFLHDLASARHGLALALLFETVKQRVVFGHVVGQLAGTCLNRRGDDFR